MCRATSLTPSGPIAALPITNIATFAQRGKNGNASCLSPSPNSTAHICRQRTGKHSGNELGKNGNAARLITRTRLTTTTARTPEKISAPIAHPTPAMPPARFPAKIGNIPARSPSCSPTYHRLPRTSQKRENPHFRRASHPQPIRQHLRQHSGNVPASPPAIPRTCMPFVPCHRTTNQSSTSPANPPATIPATSPAKRQPPRAHVHPVTSRHSLGRWLRLATCSTLAATFRQEIGNDSGDHPSPTSPHPVRGGGLCGTKCLQARF